MNACGSVGFKICSTRKRRSQRGGWNITKSVRTAVWDTKLRRSSLLLRPPASTELNWGKRTQTPSPCPRPPSRLKPQMEQKKVVVFLRERKQGAGQRKRRVTGWKANDGNWCPFGRTVPHVILFGCLPLFAGIQSQLNLEPSCLIREFPSGGSTGQCIPWT